MQVDLKLTKGPKPILEEATDSRETLKPGAEREDFPDGVTSEEPHAGISLLETNFERAAGKLDQVGGRGLRDHPRSIPSPSSCVRSGR